MKHFILKFTLNFLDCFLIWEVKKNCLDHVVFFFILLIFAFDPVPKSPRYLCSPPSFFTNLNIWGLTYALCLSGLCTEINFTDSQSKNLSYAKVHSWSAHRDKKERYKSHQKLIILTITLKIILEDSNLVPEEKENVCDVMSFKLLI